MPSNLGVIMETKQQIGYIPLYPTVNSNRVIDWSLASLFGPYTVTLNSNSWENNKQSVSLENVLSTDIVHCVKILNGTETEMVSQNTDYYKIIPQIGLESFDGYVTFTCYDKPSSDITVELYWTR